MYVQRKGKVVSKSRYNMRDINDIGEYTLEAGKNYTLQIDDIVSYRSMMGEIPDEKKKEILDQTYDGAGTTDELWSVYSKGGESAVKKFSENWVVSSPNEARINAGLIVY
jgi:hypothetical protein